jgi:hypothetical protein
VQVRDVNDDQWYPGTVTMVSPQRNVVKIHYLGWNSMWWDDTVGLDSGR